ncbi:hypothetical protein [Albibacillus kandeliae]|uniref:hypothetical protein n=1 Tax=Albibacillus kandeliae TaxID=2174228 RepID=UPI0013002997|nr:hypothetical protein [Albibacillus kandeliae]
MNTVIASGSVIRNSGKRSPRRYRTIGTLVILFVASLLMEGVLRKWILTPIQKPLFFIREPFLFLIYWCYLRYFRVNRLWFDTYLLYCYAVAVLSFAQNIFLQYPVLVPLMGFRFFCLYVPLAFIMWDVLNRDQLRRVVVFLLWISAPVAILVFFQFSSPVASPINKGISDDVVGRFTVAKDVIRPYGPFTFVLGQNAFAGMMIAIWLIAFDQRNRFKFGAITMVISGISVLTMGALSGGRTFFAYLFLALCAYILAGFTSGRLDLGAKRLMRVVIFTVCFLVTFVVIFPKAYESMSYRQETATQIEGSTARRAFRMLTAGFEAAETAPLFGYGVGAGINATRGLTGSNESFAMGEYEWERIINEFGPIFGFPLLALRSWLVLWLLYRAINFNKRYGDGSAVILWGCVGPMLATAQITMQNSMLGLCWLAVGLLLAMTKPDARLEINES